MPDAKQDRYALAIAASCIAAVRTFQQRIGENEYQTEAAVGESLRLAKMVLSRIEDT